ncbi:MAG: hypothetical protein ABIV21_06305 [Pyrinomonadaceae bacterium]
MVNEAHPVFSDVIAWANARLNPPVEIRLKFGGRGANGFVIFALIFVAFFVLGPPIFIIIRSIYNGVPPEGIAYMMRGLACLGIWIIVGLALMSAIFVLPTMTIRRHLVKIMDPSGVMTRGGAHYQWQDLKFVQYKEVRWSPRGAAGITHQAMFSGSKRISIDLVFASGKAIIPPLIKDQDAVLAIMATIPAERKEG